MTNQETYHIWRELRIIQKGESDTSGLKRTSKCNHFGGLVAALLSSDDAYSGLPSCHHEAMEDSIIDSPTAFLSGVHEFRRVIFCLVIADKSTDVHGVGGVFQPIHEPSSLFRTHVSAGGTQGVQTITNDCRAENGDCGQNGRYSSNPTNDG